MLAVINMTRIGATDKIIANAMVEGNATIDNFTQLSIIPNEAATPPIIDITNNTNGVIPNLFSSAFANNVDNELSFNCTLLEVTLPKFVFAVVSIIV